jgi:hypothetical protein
MSYGGAAKTSRRLKLPLSEGTDPMMSKSELIQKIADEASLAKKRREGRPLEALASVGYKEYVEIGRVPAAGLRQVHRGQEACH